MRIDALLFTLDLNYSIVMKFEKRIQCIKKISKYYFKEFKSRNRESILNGKK